MKAAKIGEAAFAWMRAAGIGQGNGAAAVVLVMDVPTAGGIVDATIWVDGPRGPIVEALRAYADELERGGVNGTGSMFLPGRPS